MLMVETVGTIPVMGGEERPRVVITGPREDVRRLGGLLGEHVEVLRRRDAKTLGAVVTNLAAAEAAHQDRPADQGGIDNQSSRARPEDHRDAAQAAGWGHDIADTQSAAAPADTDAAHPDHLGAAARPFGALRRRPLSRRPVPDLPHERMHEVTHNPIPKLTNQDPDEVLRIADHLEGLINTIPAPRHGDFNPHHAGCRQVIADLTTRREARATISEGRDGWRISMLGLRATGTSGFVNAARNWIAQARNTKGKT